jgi:hypothetical protein
LLFPQEDSSWLLVPDRFIHKKTIEIDLHQAITNFQADLMPLIQRLLYLPPSALSEAELLAFDLCPECPNLIKIP